MSFAEYKQLCGYAKVCHKNELVRITAECKEHIECALDKNKKISKLKQKLDDEDSGFVHPVSLVSLEKKENAKCLCNYLNCSAIVSEDLLFFVALKCKSVCGFCFFKNKSVVYKIIQNLKYHQIKQIIDLPTIIKTKEIIDSILKNNMNEMSLDDLMQIISLKEGIRLDKGVVKKLLGAINYEEMDITSGSFKIINKLITQEQFIEDNNKLLTTFLIELMTKKKMHIFEKRKLVPFFRSDYLLEHALTTSNYDCVKEIIKNSDLVHIGAKHYYTILWLYYDNFEELCTKLTNLTELIAYQYKNYLVTGSFDMPVNPSKIIETLGKIGTEDENEYFMENLVSKKRPYVKYRCDAGEVGVDMGGVSRDFYTQFFIETKQYFEENDGHFIPERPGPETKLTEGVWRIIGIICCRSIFCENISPSINFHPILCYLLLNGGYNMNFDNMSLSLKYFSLEYIENLMKLLEMKEDDYKDFMELQGEKEVIPQKKYIMKILVQKYINPNVISFVNGFRDMLKNLLFVKYVNLISFHKFVCGIECYNIIKANVHSLRNNLSINEYIDKKREKEIGEIYKTAFLNVLEDLNLKNVKKLKSFLKYWFGTSSINSFAEKKAVVELSSRDDMYGCFKSSTCFNKLYVYRQSILQFANDTKELEKKITQIIDKSLTNQEFVESLGLHMQTA